jgi:hypothetical protein
MKNELLTLDAAAARIATGAVMTIAGDEALLAQLPRGNWIGGTSVYFVTEAGGAVIRDRLYCTTLPEVTAADIRVLGADALPQIAQGYVPGGMSFILIPAFSKAHSVFAVDGPGYAGFFNQPLVGWISGVHLDEIGKVTPKVYDGSTGTAHADAAVVMHLSLPQGLAPQVDIVNIFAPDDADAPSFRFTHSGFAAKDALVDGQATPLAAYLRDNAIDTRLPLIANYGGALINVSVQSVDHATGEVAFYAPVMEGVDYRFAKPLDDYAAAFARQLGVGGEGQYSCNCILNYLYGELEGKVTGSFTGPVTFGEIAYMLLNQTLVRLELRAA